MNYKIWYKVTGYESINRQIRRNGGWQSFYGLENQEQIPKKIRIDGKKVQIIKNVLILNNAECKNNYLNILNDLRHIYKKYMSKNKHITMLILNPI